MIRTLRVALVTLPLAFGAVLPAIAQTSRPAQGTPPQGTPTQGRDREKPRSDPRREKPDPTGKRREDPTDLMTVTRRPYQALFGGATTEREPSSGLRVTGAVFGVWDQNLLAEFAGPTASVLQLSGSYANLLGDVSYTRNTSRVQVVATGGTNARYYTGLGEFAATDYHGALGLSARPTELTTVTVNQALSYAPVYLFGLFANALPPVLGAAPSPGSVFAASANDDRAFNVDSSAEVERRLTPRALIRGSAAYRRTSYVVVTPRGSDMSVVDVGGDYLYRLTEDNDLRLGYEFRQATYGGAEPFGLLQQQPAEHNLHLGVAFHPALSEERRTIVTFEGGTAIVSSFLPDNAFVTRRQVRLVGDVTIAHQMGQTWLLVGALQRGTGFVQGLASPVFTDSVSATLSGFFNRRTDFTTSLGYSNGEPSLVGSVVNFSTTTLNARLRFALAPRWALTTEYVFYHYDFSRVLPLSGGLDPRVKRNTLRAGVDMWLPIRGR